MVPQPFSIVPKDNIYCTENLNTTYHIGCNPLDAGYNTCLSRLYPLPSSGTKWARQLNVKINGTVTPTWMTCTSQTPQDTTNKAIDKCTITLDSGAKIEIETEPGTYQTMEGTVLDTTIPYIEPLKYYTNYNTST